MKQIWNKVKIQSIELNIGKTFIKCHRVDSAKLENEGHFVLLPLSLIQEMGQKARISISETL
jgi:hypothetical protein